MATRAKIGLDALLLCVVTIPRHVSANFLLCTEAAASQPHATARVLTASNAANFTQPKTILCRHVGTTGGHRNSPPSTAWLRRRMDVQEGSGQRSC